MQLVLRAAMTALAKREVRMILFAAFNLNGWQNLAQKCQLNELRFSTTTIPGLLHQSCDVKQHGVAHLPTPGTQSMRSYFIEPLRLSQSRL